MKTNYLLATQRKNTNGIPVWFMRQAGRYLPEYRELKERSSFREMSHTPEQMAEVTVQPLRRYPLDAAIMFSDILTCLEFMGATFEFTDHGPRLEKAGVSTLKNLTPLSPEKDLMFIRKGIQLIKSQIDAPLIGFAGAPFTLASYIVEGGTSKEFLSLKRFMMEEADLFDRALDHLATDIGNYLAFQVRSGVDAVQIFDSWVGVLSAREYEAFILPAMKKLIGIVKSQCQVPVTLYSQPTAHLLPYMAQTGADVLSVDWRLPLTQVAETIGDSIAIQGNLDPVTVTLDWEHARPHVHAVLEDASRAGILDRFIFNVGHGVTPLTKTDTLAHVIDYVHEFKK